MIGRRARRAILVWISSSAAASGPVTRLPGARRASATVLVRGGAGAGKTPVGLGTLRLTLAKELGGDVAVGCVEILPSEYGEQIQSARKDVSPEPCVAVLPDRPIGPGLAPRVYLRLAHRRSDPEALDLVAEPRNTRRAQREGGGRKTWSCSSSTRSSKATDIGASAPRASADAAHHEVRGAGRVRRRPFRGDAGLRGFAVGLRGGHGRRAGRRCARTGLLDRGAQAPVRRVGLRAARDRSRCRNAPRGLPRAARVGGAGFPRRAASTRLGLRGSSLCPELVWEAALQPEGAALRLGGAFVVITSRVWGVARSLAYGLRPFSACIFGSSVIEVDPLAVRRGRFSAEGSLLCHFARSARPWPRPGRSSNSLRARSIELSRAIRA